MPQLHINGQSFFADAPADTPLLWIIREDLRLTGTKYGCGLGLCGTCTVHINGEAVRSCLVKLGDVGGAAITTIEGLHPANSHAVQQAWIEHQVPQCGYCQSGQIMAAAALLKEKSQPTDKDIDDAMTNICRCGTYQRIRAAIHLAAGNKKMAAANGYTGEFTGVHGAEHAGAQAFQVLAATEIKAVVVGAQA